MKKTLCFSLLFLGAAIILSIGIPIESTHAADAPQITIAYSSNMLGYMEPCG
jgi:ABC-type phosphate transport system substrate-binding protein